MYINRPVVAGKPYKMLNRLVDMLLSGYVLWESTFKDNITKTDFEEALSGPLPLIMLLCIDG